MSYRLCLALAMVFLSACGRTTLPSPSGGGPRPAPDPREDVGREGIAAVSGLTLVPSDDVRRYLTTSTTVLKQRPDTGSDEAVIRTTLGFSLAYSRILPTRTRITGTLDQMSTTAEGPFPTLGQPSTFPLAFTGYVIGGGLFLDSLAGSPISTVVDCQAVRLNGITGIQRSIIVPPLLLSTGTTWTDSSTTPACSGSIQLSLTTVRTYTVAGQATRGLYPVIVVDRKDRVHATGEGAQGQHRISLLSQGSGSGRVYLDRTTGLLRESESAQTVDLVIGSSGRSQRFRQTVEERTHMQQ